MTTTPIRGWRTFMESSEVMSITEGDGWRAETIRPIRKRKRPSYRQPLLPTSDTCHWCGLEFRAGVTGRFAPTRDHVIPLSCGGRNHHSNAVAACYDCNTTRGTDLDWVPYWRYLRGQRTEIPTRQLRQIKQAQSRRGDTSP